MTYSERSKMSEKAAQRSLELFNSGFFCAESVLSAIAESFDVQSEWIPKIATGFCSGISRTGGICGAVSGAIMGINLVTGRSSPNQSTEENYALNQKLVSLFESHYGSIICPKLIGCDLSTDEGQHFFMENNLMEQCHQFAAGAARIAISLISE